jgi:hypothetical protein
MRDENLSPEASAREERKERLRRRLKAGVFTALLALGWAAQASAVAHAAPPSPKPAIEERVQQVRDVLQAALETETQRAGAPAQPWLNLWWNNWGNGWNNWKNNWNNWSNAWNNWNNAWNNWNNWRNLWYNV